MLLDETRLVLGHREIPADGTATARRITMSSPTGAVLGLSITYEMTSVLFASTDTLTGKTDAEIDALDAYLHPAEFAFLVAVNAIIGFVQERRAEKARDALQAMSAPRCRVIRDGSLNTVDSVQLVPGDVVELSEGGQIPAYLRLVVTADDESIYHLHIKWESNNERVDAVADHEAQALTNLLGGLGAVARELRSARNDEQPDVGADDHANPVAGTTF